MKQRMTAVAVIPFAFAMATAAPATAAPWDEPTPQQTEPWPDEGSGYPGYGDQSAPASADEVNQATALDTTSVVLGALGGIAIGGVALGTTLVVQRRRDHATSAHA
jgi:hypothetical protein